MDLMSIFERFTPEAKEVLALAQKEANDLNQYLIGAEHILLGLLLQKGAAAQILGELGISHLQVRDYVESIGRPIGGSSV